MVIEKEKQFIWNIVVQFYNFKNAEMVSNTKPKVTVDTDFVSFEYGDGKAVSYDKKAVFAYSITKKEIEEED